MPLKNQIIFVEYTEWDKNSEHCITVVDAKRHFIGRIYKNETEPNKIVYQFRDQKHTIKIIDPNLERMKSILVADKKNLFELAVKFRLAKQKKK